MKYLADLLTVLRLGCAVATLALLLQSEWGLAATVFGIGLLSDAFDGVAARRWPYDDDADGSRWWRRNPHAFDNAADLSLSSAGFVGVCVMLLPTVQAIGVLIGVAGISLMFVQHIAILVEEGRPQAAEKTDVIHGFVYGIEMAGLLVIMTIVATTAWPMYVAAYLVVAVPLLWIKRDRLMSRSEVDYSRH